MPGPRTLLLLRHEERARCSRFLYKPFILDTLAAEILKAMRKSVLVLLACLLALPAAAGAALLAKKGDGTLSVEDGRGVVVLSVRGGVIGRFDRGAITIVDLSPRDRFEPRVWGAERENDVRGGRGERYAGQDVRFRLIGGEFFILVNGTGIDLSAVGNGWTTLNGRGRNPGVFSLEGEDCAAPRTACRDLPEVARTFRLGDEPLERSNAAPDR